MTQSEGETFCETLGSSLPRIQSDEEQKFLNQLLFQAGIMDNLWIGLEGTITRKGRSQNNDQGCATRSRGESIKSVHGPACLNFTSVNMPRATKIT